MEERRQAVIKIIKPLLIAAVCAAILAPAAAAQEDEYSLAVDWAAENGIITTDENGQLESPDSEASRAQAAAMLARLKCDGIAHGGIVYTDVSESDWFYSDVCAVSAAGLMTGDGEFFRPDDSITREEAVVLAGRAFELDATETSDTVFTDSDDISDWAKDYVYTAAGLGIVNGTDSGAFMPKASIKRRDLLLILYRCDRAVSVSAVVDDDGSVWTPLY